MPGTHAVVAHAGEEVLYVLGPVLVLFVGWRVWERLRGAAAAEPDADGDDAGDDAGNDAGDDEG